MNKLSKIGYYLYLISLYMIVLLRILFSNKITEQLNKMELNINILFTIYIIFNVIVFFIFNKLLGKTGLYVMIGLNITVLCFNLSEGARDWSCYICQDTKLRVI